MKKTLAILAIAALLTGCATARKALMLTQEIEGSGSVTVESPAQLTTVVVDNARQEGDRFHADQFDLTHRGKWLGEKIDLHLKNYSRPLIGPKLKGE